MADKPIPEMVERVARSLARSTALRLFPVSNTIALRTQEDITWRGFIVDAERVWLIALSEPSEEMTRPLRELFRGPGGVTITHEMMCVAWGAVIAAALGRQPTITVETIDPAGE